jgi:meso-butanediol dehydrogenase / (S,S)-butanediol dehydrogenase / diacetyl reductase
MSKRLEGRVALITGTGGGQGRAGAIRFAQEGALVIGCDLVAEGNDETVEMGAGCWRLDDGNGAGRPR